MPLTRTYEELEVSPELRRIYADIRTSFDLPWVPSIFKLAAGIPDYMKLSWNDLGPVVRSREFQASAKALEEYVRSLAISDGWAFKDHERLLAAQKFSPGDIEQLGAILSIFVRAIPKMALFVRLLQRGYSGGQRGKISGGRQASALSRMITLNVPSEKDAGIRTWLIYNDIRKTTGCKNIISLFRVMSPFPGYLASVWYDSKKLFGQPDFIKARDEVARRSLALIAGLPVRDHRKLQKNVTAEQWRNIEESVDSFSRMLPQIALLAAVWQRSFPNYGNVLLAA